MGDTDGYTVITDIRQVDFNDEMAVMNEIGRFAETYAYAGVEHALVITPAGNAYSLRGTELSVNPGIISRDELVGSIVVHNHPGSEADSFSRYDFASFFDLGLSREEVVFGSLHHTMRYIGVPVTPNKANDLYRIAFNDVRRNAMQTGIPIKHEQLETMRQLSRTMEGLIFNENT